MTVAAVLLGTIAWAFLALGSAPSRSPAGLGTRGLPCPRAWRVNRRASACCGCANGERSLSQVDVGDYVAALLIGSQANKNRVAVAAGQGLRLGIGHPNDS